MKSQKKKRRVRYHSDSEDDFSDTNEDYYRDDDDDYYYYNSDYDDGDDDHDDYLGEAHDAYDKHTYINKTQYYDTNQAQYFSSAMIISPFNGEEHSAPNIVPIYLNSILCTPSSIATSHNIILCNAPILAPDPIQNQQQCNVKKFVINTISSQDIVSISVVFPRKSSWTEDGNTLGSAFKWIIPSSWSGYKDCEIVFLLNDGSFLSCGIPYGSNVSLEFKAYEQSQFDWYTIPCENSHAGYALEFCKQQIGKGFNSAGLCAVVLPVIGMWIPYDAKGKAWFSSELCMAVLQQISPEYSKYRPCKVHPRLLESILQSAISHSV